MTSRPNYGLVNAALCVGGCGPFVANTCQGCGFYIKPHLAGPTDKEKQDDR